METWEKQIIEDVAILKNDMTTTGRALNMNSSKINKLQKDQANLVLKKIENLSIKLEKDLINIRKEEKDTFILLDKKISESIKTIKVEVQKVRQGVIDLEVRVKKLEKIKT